MRIVLLSKLKEVHYQTLVQFLKNSWPQDEVFVIDFVSNFPCNCDAKLTILSSLTVTKTFCPSQNSEASNVQDQPIDQQTLHLSN